MTDLRSERLILDIFIVVFCLSFVWQDNQNLHNQDVEKAYGEALEALNLWKMKSVEAITKRYSRWKDEFNASVKLLQIQAEELEGMLETSKDLLSSVDVDFLQVIHRCMYLSFVKCTCLTPFQVDMNINIIKGCQFKVNVC